MSFNDPVDLLKDMHGTGHHGWARRVESLMQEVNGVKAVFNSFEEFYASINKLIATLVDENPEPDSPAGKLLDGLINAVAEYEAARKRK